MLKTRGHWVPEAELTIIEYVLKGGVGARTLLVAPGIPTRSKKLLGDPGIATRSKDATRGKGHRGRPLGGR